MANGQPSIKQSEIESKALKAANEVIEAGQEAAQKWGYDFSEENMEMLRRRTVEAYIRDIREAGYYVYDP